MELIGHAVADIFPLMNGEDAAKYNADAMVRHIGVSLDGTYVQIEPFATDPAYVYVVVIRSGIADLMKRPVKREYALGIIPHLQVDGSKLAWRSEPTDGSLVCPFSGSFGRVIERLVYFVAAPSAGLVKIGHTSSIDDRFETLQAMSPVPLELLAIMPDDGPTEAELHRRFAHLRKHGEWFVLCDELLSYIAAIPSTEAN